MQSQCCDDACNIALSEINGGNKKSCSRMGSQPILENSILLNESCVTSVIAALILH